MIPKVIPPLSGATILVTRPAQQGESLCSLIEHFGGTAIRFPTIAIEPISISTADTCDLAVFVSVNAVAHGRQLVAPDGSVRIAAIGKATAAALREAQLRVDYVPEAGFTSEALLAHPELKLIPGMRALIIKGEGGRGLLEQTFESHGLTVQTCEVYRRVRPPLDEALRDALENRWAETGLDVVTLTSVATLDHLMDMLSERGRDLVQSADAVVVSERVREAAAAAGIRGEIIVAAAADDASIVGALARWRTRART